jgi:hypothetical protein
MPFSKQMQCHNSMRTGISEIIFDEVPYFAVKDRERLYERLNFSWKADPVVIPKN